MSRLWQQRSPKRRTAKGGSGTRKPRKKCFPRLGRQRRQANQRERVRAQRITDAIDDLRCVLWKDESSSKGKSIILTLRTAMDYISILHKTVAGEDLLEKESGLLAYGLLEKYCQKDLLTTRASRPPPPTRPDSLLLNLEKTLPPVEDSYRSPDSGTLSSSSSGYSSSCLSLEDSESNVGFPECNFSLDDLLLKDLPELNDIVGLHTGPLDLVNLLNVSFGCLA